VVVFSPAARHNLISLVSLIISAMPGGKPGQGTIPMPDRIRVSCASLCRIEHEGWFLLLLNADRRQRGLYVLSPIGGALSITAYDRLAPFAAILETPQNDDLRLTLPRAKLPHFREWFYSGQGRERSPFRELREELVDEASLLPALEPEDVTWEHLWTAEEEAQACEVDARFQSEEWLNQRGGLRQTGIKIHQDVRVVEGATKAPGGLVRATLRLRQGRIDDIVLSGDFTLTPAFALASLEQSLRGVTVSQDALSARVQQAYRATGIQSPGLAPEHFVQAILAAAGAS